MAFTETKPNDRQIRPGNGDFTRPDSEIREPALDIELHARQVLLRYGSGECAMSIDRFDDTD